MLPNASLRAAFFSALVCLHAVQSVLRSPGIVGTKSFTGFLRLEGVVGPNGVGSSSSALVASSVWRSDFDAVLIYNYGVRRHVELKLGQASLDKRHPRRESGPQSHGTR